MRKQLMMVLQGGGGGEVHVAEDDADKKVEWDAEAIDDGAARGRGGGGGGGEEAVGMEEEGWQGEQSAMPQGADAHCTRTAPTQTPLPFTPAKILGHVVCTHAWSSCPPPFPHTKPLVFTPA